MSGLWPQISATTRGDAGRRVSTIEFYWLEGVACAEVVSGVFSGALSETGVAVPILVRNGKKGVTSKGIFSAGELRATGLVLINSSRSLQGSTRTRPPRGKAAIWSVFLGSKFGEAVIKGDMRIASPLRRLSP